jgi:hypothetical protein
VVLSGYSGSSTTKTGHHDIVEILLKVALKHQKSKIKSIEGDETRRLEESCAQYKQLDIAVTRKQFSHCEFSLYIAAYVVYISHLIQDCRACE